MRPLRLPLALWLDQPPNSTAMAGFANGDNQTGVNRNMTNIHFLFEYRICENMSKGEVWDRK
jgi:hypothetical protein